MPDARNAYQDMKRIYEYYSNRKFNEPKPKSGQARVKMIHYIQRTMKALSRLCSLSISIRRSARQKKRKLRTRKNCGRS